MPKKTKHATQGPSTSERPSEQPVQAQAQQKLVHVEPRNGVIFSYANHVEIGSTIFDVRMLFGEILNATPEELKVLIRVHVTMTWVEAKLLHRLLGQILEAREKELGTIQVPDAAPTQMVGERTIRSAES